MTETSGEDAVPKGDSAASAMDETDQGLLYRLNPDIALIGGDTHIYVQGINPVITDQSTYPAISSHSVFDPSSSSHPDAPSCTTVSTHSILSTFWLFLVSASVLFHSSPDALQFVINFNNRCPHLAESRCPLEIYLKVASLLPGGLLTIPAVRLVWGFLSRRGTELHLHMLDVLEGWKVRAFADENAAAEHDGISIPVERLEIPGEWLVQDTSSASAAVREPVVIELDLETRTKHFRGCFWRFLNEFAGIGWYPRVAEQPVVYMEDERGYAGTADLVFANASGTRHMLVDLKSFLVGVDGNEGGDHSIMYQLSALQLGLERVGFNIVGRAALSYSIDGLFPVLFGDATEKVKRMIREQREADRPKRIVVQCSPTTRHESCVFHRTAAGLTKIGIDIPTAVIEIAKSLRTPASSSPQNASEEKQIEAEPRPKPHPVDQRHILLQKLVAVRTVFEQGLVDSRHLASIKSGANKPSHRHKVGSARVVLECEDDEMAPAKKVLTTTRDLAIANMTRYHSEVKKRLFAAQKQRCEKLLAMLNNKDERVYALDILATAKFHRACRKTHHHGELVRDDAGSIIRRVYTKPIPGRKLSVLENLSRKYPRPQSDGPAPAPAPAPTESSAPPLVSLKRGQLPDDVDLPPEPKHYRDTHPIRTGLMEIDDEEEEEEEVEEEEEQQHHPRSGLMEIDDEEEEEDHVYNFEDDYDEEEEEDEKEY